MEAIVAGVVANGLWAFLGLVWQSKPRPVDSVSDLDQLIRSDDSLTTVLEKAVQAAASLSGLGPGSKVKLLLASSELVTVVRQVYAGVRGTKGTFALDAIRSEVQAIVDLHLGSGTGETEQVDEFFGSLVDLCEKSLAVAIDKGVLSAHEASSAARHRAVMDELAAINRAVEVLADTEADDLKEYGRFEAGLRKSVKTRHGTITPPHFDGAPKVPLEDLYVSSSLRIKVSANEHHDIDHDSFLAILHRAVVLGNPGAGKSTFTQSVCRQLVDRYESLRVSGRQVTPIVVRLRDYGIKRQELSCSLADFMALAAASMYQIKAPDGAIEYLLMSGRLFVILDGLDELLDTSYRQEISADIETFCNRYPATPVLVTSRAVGYEQAPLDPRLFASFALSEFDDGQVADYAHKWFAVDEELTGEEARSKAESFLAESGSVADLRSNPLMLALMCNIYRGENYIPRNRTEVYEKCAVMLFERWDKTRGLEVALPFQEHVRPAMQHLAGWIYSGEALQAGVTESALIEEAASYLLGWRFEDPDAAKGAATEFVSFCRGRAWVFTDTGTEASGERLYQFTHRTFLEYFAAVHLVRTNSSTRELLEVLLPRVQQREWDVVAQLAFQLRGRGTEGAGDELLAGLLPSTDEPAIEDWMSTLFALRALEFMVPRPATARSVLDRGVEALLAWDREPLIEAGHEGPARGRALAQEMVVAMADVSDENWMVVADQIRSRVLAELASSEDWEESTIKAAELPDWLRTFAEERRHERLHDVSKELRSINPQGVSESLHLAQRAVWDGDLELDDFIVLHGLEEVFLGAESLLIPNSWRSPSVIQILRGSLPSDVSRQWGFPRGVTYYRRELDALGKQLLARAALPLRVEAPSVRRATPLFWVVGDEPIYDFDAERSLTRSATFGFLASVLVFLELDPLDRVHVLRMKPPNSEIVAVLNALLQCRYEEVDQARVQEALDRAKLSDEARDVLASWATQDLDLVREIPSAG